MMDSAESLLTESNRKRGFTAGAQLVEDESSSQWSPERVPGSSEDTTLNLTGAAASTHNAEPAVTQAVGTEALLRKRRQVIGPNAALQYRQPLHLVRGQGTYLYDQQGARYLDCVNNVAHVGHCHPRVAAAVAEQMMMLNTNSRYLHDNLTDHAAAIVATMPTPLEVYYPVTSGSEANDLALRIARASRPAALHVAVMAGAYHGHTTATIDLSPYKFDGPGGAGRPAHVHVLPCPDLYRGTHLDGRQAARAAIREAHRQGGRIGAFFSESILSCGGQMFFPEGYLVEVYEEMRAEGAVCVADEVQCGFGRVGTHFWGFETQRVVPDLVTLGKPIGNGFPMGGVVATRRLADGFANGMEYFSTCGGCTAAGAAGLAVLQVIQAEGLQANSLRVGAYLLERLKQLQQAHSHIMGHVRGAGLFIGIEFVTDPAARRHFGPLARWVKEACKARRVLLTTDGPHDNVVKIKPPLVFAREDADQLMETLSSVLRTGLTKGVMQGLLKELDGNSEVTSPAQKKQKT